MLIKKDPTSYLIISMVSNFFIMVDNVERFANTLKVTLIAVADERTSMYLNVYIFDSLLKKRISNREITKGTSTQHSAKTIADK